VDITVAANGKYSVPKRTSGPERTAEYWGITSNDEGGSLFFHPETGENRRSGRGRESLGSFCKNV